MSHLIFVKQQAPGPGLAFCIETYWEIRVRNLSADPTENRITPHGRPEILFNLGSPIARENVDFNHDTSARAIVYGQQKGSIGLRSLPDFHLFGVRFKTGGLFPFAGGTPLREITNRTLDLEELWPGRADQALDQIRGAKDFAERVRLIESILSAVLRERYEEDPLLNSVLKQLHLTNGNIRIESLAERHSIHHRRLNRLFEQKIGVAPRVLARILRFHNAFYSMNARGHYDLAAILDQGFYDQSHFINEFKYFAGESPKAFFSREQSLAKLFRQRLKFDPASGPSPETEAADLRT